MAVRRYKYKGASITQGKNGKFFIHGLGKPMIAPSLQAAKKWINKNTGKKKNPARRRVSSGRRTRLPLKAIKDRAGFMGFNEYDVKVENKSIPDIKQLIFVGPANNIDYLSDKFNGKTKLYTHTLKKKGKVYMINVTKNCKACLITDVNLTMTPRGLVG